MRFGMFCAAALSMLALACGGGGGGGKDTTGTDNGTVDAPDGTVGPDGTCTPQCDGKKCGSNGCGGTCGTCKDGEKCDEKGACVPDVVDAPCCEARDRPGCEDPAVEKCVCAKNALCCTKIWDTTCVADVEKYGCGK